MLTCRSIYFRIIQSRRVIAVRRISSSEDEKQRNPFRKAVRIRRLVYDYGDKIANRICLSVIGNGAIGEPQTLGMFTDYKSYLFNCGEGTARVFREHDLRFYDVSHVFITHKDWKKMSGLPDMYLNLQNVCKRKLTLHGPPHIEDFFGVTVSYEKYLKIFKKPVENQVYEDDTMQIQYVTVFASYSVSSELRSGTHFYSHKLQGKKPGVSFLSKGSDMAVCYICKCIPKPRKLSWERCVELNVPVGPLLLELKNGNDITLPSGKKVLAEDVLDPADPGTVFLVVDCPSKHFLDSFISEEKFKPYQMPSSEIPVAVVHFTPTDIFDSYQYQKWISRFSPDVHHIVLNAANVMCRKSAAHQLQDTLNLLHPRIFKSLPKHNVEVDPPTSRNIIQAEGGLMLHLRPSVYLDHGGVAVSDTNCDVQHAKETPGFSESLSQLHSHLQERMQKSKSGDTYPEVIFFGTGSARSSAYRSCSCILVNVSADQSVMFDCGDGAFQQLVRYFGPNEIKNVLKRISCIFISHHHTDHYMGLFEVIRKRKEAFYLYHQSYVPLVVTIPRLFNKIFDNYESMFGPIRSDIRIVRNSILNTQKGDLDVLKKFLGNLTLHPVPVNHCCDSYGVVLSNGSKWKIAFSGDCSPSHSLIDAGKDCTLLIHEATLEDELEQEALSRRHSTISQALDVSKQMNAQHTIVTHFCSFYVEVPHIKDSYEDHNVGIAFDFMRVRLRDLPCLPLFIPVVRNLFSGRLELHQVGANSNAGFETVALRTLRS